MFSTTETNSRKRKIGNRGSNTGKRQWELQEDGEGQSQDEGCIADTEQLVQTGECLQR